MTDYYLSVYFKYTTYILCLVSQRQRDNNANDVNIDIKMSTSVMIVEPYIKPSMVVILLLLSQLLKSGKPQRRLFPTPARVHYYAVHVVYDVRRHKSAQC